MVNTQLWTHFTLKVNFFQFFNILSRQADQELYFEF